ncbi:hypothetical protein GGI12_001989 [Dipsacomyces acuminosporus]|nr:hypothetical protein GGI12_001989 [Dipsacomyces acuminosporus]
MIVLDLNGTLIKRTKRNTFGGCRYGYARPYLHKFLRFILDNFAVMVWSSAQPNSVFNMLKVMFGGMDKELVRVWDRRFCELDDHYFSNAESLKDLTRITNGFNLGHSPFNNIYKSYTGGYSGIDNEAKQGRWTLENIVLVDDSEEKAAKQQANHLFVTTFDDIHKGDKELLVLVKYLQRYAENRQAFDSLVSYMQSNPWLEFRDSCVVDEDEEAIFQNKQPF